MSKLHLFLMIQLYGDFLIPLDAVKMKLEQYQLEIQYILQVFCAIYKKFLTAIDHIDYHPSQQNMTRIKRSEIYNQYRHYHTQSQILTPSEENFLDEFLKALYQINPPLHKESNLHEKSWYPYLDIRMGSIYQC